MKKVALALLVTSVILLSSCDLILFSSMDDLAPASPTNVRFEVDPLGNNPPKLAWNASEGAAWYVVYVKSDLSDTHVRPALRADHWLHAYTNADWGAVQTQAIKAQIRKAFYPDTEE